MPGLTPKPTLQTQIPPGPGRVQTRPGTGAGQQGVKRAALIRRSFILFYFILATPCGWQCLSSPTGD